MREDFTLGTGSGSQVGFLMNQVAYLAKPIKERTIGEISDWRHDKTEKEEVAHSEQGFEDVEC